MDLNGGKMLNLAYVLLLTAGLNAGYCLVSEATPQQHENRYKFLGLHITLAGLVLMLYVGLNMNPDAWLITMRAGH